MTKTNRCILLIVAACAALPATASAAPRPHLTLAFAPQGADSDQPVAYRWTASNTRPGAVVLQRQTGTSRVWRTVARLRGNGGSGQLSGRPLGSYQLRIANIGPTPKHKVFQQVRTLRVFGDVPLGTLLRGGTRGVLNTPTATFPYVDGLPASHGSTQNRRDTFSRNYCRSLHLSFASDYLYSLDGDKDFSQLQITAQVSQESRDATTASAAVHAIGSLDADLVPGQSWSIGASVVGTADLLDFELGSFGMFINGTASCYSSAQIGTT